jgi:tetratricopeptide (TPR) repeat protein
MKRWLVCFVLLVVTLMQGCRGDDKEGRTEKLLNSKPFEDLTDSIHDFPDDQDLYLKRGLLLSQNNFHEQAVADYKKAWEIKPDESTAFAYSSGLFLSGREEEAIVFLKQCLATFPDSPEFARRLSEAYLQTGKTAEALEQYNSILEKDPMNFEAWYEKGIILAQMKDTLQAITAFETAYTLQPIQLFGITLANLYAETKNAKALALCDELLEKDFSKELTDAVYIKGIYYANINQPEQALKYFEECIRRDWKFTEAYIEKGLVLYRQKNYDEALKNFALAAKVSNTDADTYFWMARCYEATGKLQDARENYQRALALDRDFSEAREGLKRINK